MSDEVNTQITMPELKYVPLLEGLLWIVGDEGLTKQKAREVLGITNKQFETCIQLLQEEYNKESHGVQVVGYGDIYRFLTKPSVSAYAISLLQITKKNTLSQAALETLAIIAYKQPITRVEIEEIRGVGAEVMLRKLIARDLIREAGRADSIGRPILYEVSEEFMNAFGLVSLEELPELPNFREESEELFE